MPTKNHLNAVALLKADHREVEELFTEFEGAAGATKKQALVEKICTELSAHTVIEEFCIRPAGQGRRRLAQ
jgi:hemerythrin superfamily protein